LVETSSRYPIAPFTLLQWAVKLLVVISVAASAVGGAGVAAGVGVGGGVAVGVDVAVGAGVGVGVGFPCPLGVGVGVGVGVDVAVAVGVGDGIVAQSPGPALLSMNPETVPVNGEDTGPEGGSPPVVFTTTTKLWPAGTVNE
jgi:hypothetical protein